uniref:Fibronectin type-III domain-containing protein n=2 Tax=Steinernema glaseri TaxID=37863 RepID=A0A1I8A9L7_9BILA
MRTSVASAFLGTLLIPLVASLDLHLTTTDDGYMTVIQGFATQLECTVNTCVRHVSTVNWYKDDLLLFNGTEFVSSSGVDPSSVLLQHSIGPEKPLGTTECPLNLSPTLAECINAKCSSSADCDDGFHCVESEKKCCKCGAEEFTVLLKNLTFNDAGRYRCQLSNQMQQLEFQIEVLESDIHGGFHENITYDHSDCCEKKGISPLCKAMCRPQTMGQDLFDPTSCKTNDFKHFLQCGTAGGKRNYVDCCRNQQVPSFCFDFCSADFKMLKKSHRLCLYYLPEIFECFNRASLPYPDPPKDVQVTVPETKGNLRVCWKAPSVALTPKQLEILFYTINLKKMNNAPSDTMSDGRPLRSSARVKRKLTTVDSDEGFQKINTTQTCHTLQNLGNGKTYTIYVTSTNQFGMSVPSVRRTATTNI